LAPYSKEALTKEGIQYAVTYEQVTETNIINFADDLKVHDHEEADTLIILHAIDVAIHDPFLKCVILSPDTDVFLLLLHYYESLPQHTLFKREQEKTFEPVT
jgi:hypothetical protein